MLSRSKCFVVLRKTPNVKDGVANPSRWNDDLEYE